MYYVFYCEDCKTELRRARDEYYCPRCGLVKEMLDFHRLTCDFDQSCRNKALHPWSLKLRQTKRAFRHMKNGKLKLLFKKRRYAR